MFLKPDAKTSTDFEPSTEVFPTIAAAPIARKLQLEKRGRTDGQQNYPASDATGLTTAEQEIVSEITRLRKRGIDAFDLHFNAYQGRIDLSQSAVSQINMQAGKLRNEMISESKTQQNIVMNKLRAVREFNAGLDDYRKRNRLVAPPKEAQSLWTVALMIFCFFAVEISLGALFFQDHSPGGLIGSATYAIMIALVNVAISGMLGHFSRYATLRSVKSKIIGGLSTAVFVVFAVAFNLFVGHYRKATDEMPWEEAAYAMYDSFIAAPFDLGSFNAILIAVFGVVVSIFAYLKLRGWEDIHPGYNRVYDAMHDAIEDYAEAYQDTEKKLNELFEDSQKALTAEAHELRGIVRGAANAHVGQKTLIANLEAFLDECSQITNALLRTYREANERSRATPPPNFFGQSFSFPSQPRRYVTGLAADRIDREITRINEAADRGVRDILEARQEQLSALMTTEALLHGIEKGAILESSPAATLEIVTGGRG